LEIKFRIWDGNEYRYPEPEGDLTTILGSRYIWTPMFFKASSPIARYELEIYTGKHDEQGNEVYKKINDI